MQQAQNTGSNINAGVKTGAELAQSIETLKNQRAQIEQKKQELYMQKFEKVGSWFDTVAKMEDGPAKKAFAGEFIPKGIAALGLENEFDPTALKMFQGDPTSVKFLVDQVRRGGLDASVLITAGKDPETAAKLLGAAKNGMLRKNFEDVGALQQAITGREGSLLSASKFREEQVQKNTRTDTIAQNQFTRQQQAQSAAGQVELSKKVADSFAKFTSEGGMAAAESKLSKIDEALSQLESGKIKTGTISTKVPGARSDLGQATVNPDVKALGDSIKSAISLKGSLDSQFSQREAELAFARAFDPALPTNKNIEKLRAMRRELKNDLKAKQGQYEQQGFLEKKFTGKYQPSDRQRSVYRNASPDQQAAIIKRLQSEQGISAEAARAGLEQ